MAYRIALSRRAEKELAGLPSAPQLRIVRAIQTLADDPFRAANVKKLVAAEGFRLRVGDWRVVFKIERDRQVIVILALGHRREIYR